MDLHLKPGKDRPVRVGHPWIFSGALREVDHGIEPGTLVRVCSADGDVIGRGYLNPRCSIAVRMLVRSDEPIGAEFFARRVSSALALRREMVGADTDAYRVINGEGDWLPGFVVDRYGDMCVLQCLTAGAERLKPLLLQALVEALSPTSIYERSEGSVREAEGLPPFAGTLHGTCPSSVTVRQNGLLFRVDPVGGQKTGLFLDQRVNRLRARELARGRRVLDAFCYTGGFAVHAGAAGAEYVVAVDSSAAAVESARENWRLNGLGEASRFVRSDVNRFLRETDDRFGLLVLDPPALVKHRRDLARGARAYKDLQLWALRRAEPDALLMTFSCSAHVDAELFRKIVLGAAADAGREVQLLERLGAGPDHPTSLAHPEGEYLSGLLLRVF